MTGRQLKAFVGDLLRGCGFERRGACWVKLHEEMTWIVNVAKSPYAARYSVELGVQVHRLSDITVSRPSDCHLLIALEQLPLAVTSQSEDPRFSDYRSGVIRSLDLTLDFEDDYRKELIRAIVDAMCVYATSVNSESELITRFASGDFAAAGIRKELRAVLSA